MRVTASGNVSKKLPWNGLKNHHLNHDPNQKHSNEFLNTNKSKNLMKFNVKFANDDSFEEIVEKYFGNYQLDHDMNTKGYKWENIENFINFDTKGNHRRNQLDFVFTEKITDKETWDKLTQRFSEVYKKANSKTKKNLAEIGIRSGDEFTAYKASKALKNYMQTFEDRNTNLTFIEGDGHVDELGSPHAHMRLMATPDKETGITKSGRVKKPSTSLNKALRAQFPEAENNKDAMSLWRKQEDEALLKCFSQELGLKLELRRKTKENPSLKTGLAHEEYVRQRKFADKAAEKYKRQKIEEIDAKVEDYKYKRMRSANASYNAWKNTKKDELKQELWDDVNAFRKASGMNPQELAKLGIYQLARDKARREKDKTKRKKYGDDAYNFMTEFCGLTPAEAMEVKDFFDSTPTFDEMIDDIDGDEKKKSKNKDDDLDFNF